MKAESCEQSCRPLALRFSPSLSHLPTQGSISCSATTKAYTNNTLRAPCNQVGTRQCFSMRGILSMPSAFTRSYSGTGSHRHIVRGQCFFHELMVPLQRFVLQAFHTSDTDQCFHKLQINQRHLDFLLYLISHPHDQSLRTPVYNYRQEKFPTHPPWSARPSHLNNPILV